VDGEIIVHLFPHVIDRDGSVTGGRGDDRHLRRPVFRGRSAERVIGPDAKTVSRCREVQKSAGELFVPQTGVSGGRRIGGIVICEPAVTEIKAVTGVVDGAAAFCVGAGTDVGIGEAIANTTI
jgi:hypothetical protein